MKRISTKKLNHWRNKAWGISEMKGFHDCGNPSNHNQLFAGVSEVGEFIDCLRSGKKYDFTVESFQVIARPDWNHKDKQYFEKHVKETQECELADIVIWLLDLAGERGIEFNKAIEPGTIDISNRFKMNEAIIDLVVDIVTLKYSINTLIQSVFMFAWSLDIDLEFFVEAKMKYNELRPMLNGKKF